MVVSTLVRKSFNDLKKRKSRTFFTILTIAIAVMGFGLFAVVPLMNQTMLDEIDNSNMYDVQLNMNDLELNETDFRSMEDIDNVRSAEGKFLFFTRIYIGERRNDALFVGVDDFNDQSVDIVEKYSGSHPGHGQVLTDTGNSRSNLYNGGIGDTVKAYDSSGQLQEFEITGSGHSLIFYHASMGIAVFYTDMETIHELANGSGYNYLSFDLERSSENKAEASIDQIETYLSENTEFVAFTELPEKREDGSWPGGDGFADMGAFFSILTLLTMFCSVFLISNTMHTMVSEQRKEIAQMKSIGATRRQISRSILTTSIMIGLIGATIGVVLGVFVAFQMESFLGNAFFGVAPAFAVHWQTVILGFLIGIGFTILATIPALLKALKITVREGMESVAITKNGSSSLHRTWLRFNRLPRTAQMGVRNITRKKGRSASTMIQVALAVGMFLAIICLGVSISTMVEKEFDNFTYDIMATGQTSAGKPLTEDMKGQLEAMDGVSEVEPFIATGVMIDENNVLLLGYYHDTFSYNYEKTLQKGHWFTENEVDSNSRVIVVSKGIARLTEKGVGDKLMVMTATGPHEFDVIGIDKGQMNNGMVSYAPYTTIQELLVLNNTVSGFTIRTDTDDHGAIDRISTSIEDNMIAGGYVVNIEIMYVMAEQNQEEIKNIMNLMLLVGGLIVLITMIGLMSTLTMNVIERTKEVGMMRCIGSRAGHIRGVFGMEGLTLGLIGWVIGIPVGYAVGRYLTYMLYDLMNLEITFIFPFEYILLSLMVTAIVTAVVIQPPLWRATHLKPGDALRYE